VINVALLSVIRRWYFRDKESIRAIARKSGLSRNTVRKYLHSNVVEPQYPQREPAGKLKDYLPKLTQWLASEPKKPRKLRRNLRSMYRDLVALGFTGSYDRVCAFARQCRQTEQYKAQTAGKGCFIPLIFACGEAFQFDWSEDFARIAGKQVKLQIAQFKLAYSRVFVLRAYYQQKHEMLFDAHWHAFQVFGGIPKRGIYDNMKTAVDSVGRGKDRKVNQRFSAMVSHYLFEAQFCNPASGWEKGQIEKNVQDSRQRLWQGAPEFQSLDELNTWLENRCKALWSELRHPELDQTLSEVLADEQSELMELPPAFDAFVEQVKRVTSTSLVHHEGNRYSVPATYANRAISLRVYADKLVMACEGQSIAEHTRLFGSGHTQYDWRHYLSVLEKKPGALRNGAPFAQLPDGFKTIQSILQQRAGGNREMVEILALVLHHDEQAVLSAVELALECGKPSKEHVLNLLGRLTEELPAKSIAIPDELKLSLEPHANVSRYDSLRGAHDAA
jgi:transposase